MGFWDFLSRSRADVGVDHMTPYVTHYGDLNEVLNLVQLGTLTPAQMWSTQPHLRTVVSFLARNIAQLGVHTFERVGETDRVRDRTSTAAQLFRRPNAHMTSFELVYALVGDLALYDTAYWLLARDEEAPSGWALTRLPVPWVTPLRADLFSNRAYIVRGPQGESVEVPASQVLAFSGFHPSNPRSGSPTIESLRETLQEQIEASKFRNQVWKRGGRVSSVIERPADAPAWSPEAMEQFREDWYAKYTGTGSKAGGTPILEDGMQLKRIDFSAKDQEFVEGAKLSFATVAAAFHVNPTMVGILDNANYSNVREFRRMLYGDTLGPLLAQIEDRVNTFLLPMLGMDSGTFYAEFNIAEKLQGSFEEQAAVMSTLVGRPIMSADEGRARFNLPAMGGEAEQLVVPLNVLLGGQASPRDSAPPPKAHAVLTKARAPQPYEAKAEEVVRAFFKRQGAVVLTRLGVKSATSWWDEQRWNDELTADLYKLGVATSETVAHETLSKLGREPGEYDTARTQAFLKSVAARIAASINASTQGQLEDALTDEDPPAAARKVFENAEGSRSTAIATTAVTAWSGFAAVESAKQSLGDEAVKTWITGSNPRKAHAAMSGEQAPVSELFSNGLMWPGDGGVAEQVANCNCSLSITHKEDQ